MRNIMLSLLIVAIFWQPISTTSGDFYVVFKSPMNLNTVSGKVSVEVEVVREGDVEIEKVVFLVNGVLTAEWKEPPYQFLWDAGSEFKEWRLAVIAYAADGRSASRTIRTRELKIDQLEHVDLVNIYASVKDKSGQFVMGLSRQDFLILDKGVKQNIERFSQEWRPLLAAIVFDSSLTMKGEKLRTAKEAAIAFLDSFGRNDRVAVISFSDKIKVLEDFTINFEAVKKDILQIEAGGGTALYDAIYRASEMMKGQDARKVIILLSDGRDESTSGLTPGSLHTFEESIDRALRNDVIIFSIGVGKSLHKEMDFYDRRSLREILEQLAFDTGGIFYTAERIRQIEKAFVMIADELKHQYFMAFLPSHGVRDGSWRTIQVKTRDPNHRIITRKGYFSPKD
ncbi:MAG: VWA domain-containing protein [Acidobacteriota bacterium]